MDSSQQKILELARDVSTRSEMLAFLSHSLDVEYRIAIEEGVRQTSTFVKSYLLEAHDDAIPRGNKDTSLFSTLTELNDGSIQRAETFDGHIFFIDSSIPRFQIIHTIEKADIGDRLFANLTNGRFDGIDRCWFPSQFLENLKIGVLTGFGMQFTPIGPASFTPSEQTSPILDPETGEVLGNKLRNPSFRLNFTGGVSAREELHELLGGTAFRGRRALSQIETSQYDIDDLSRRLTSTIYSNGKIVGHGSGIERHIRANIATLDAYSRVLESWENEAAFGWIPIEDHFIAQGMPFVFEYPNLLTDEELESLVEFVFTSGPPFRLLGMPLVVNPGQIDVDAIDLHTGDRVRFEFGQNSLRLLLPIGTCANVVLRFWSNFERFLAAEIMVSVSNDYSPIARLLSNEN